VNIMPKRVDELMSEGMGKMKGVKARLSGLVGVFQTLAEQHGEAGALLKRIKADAGKRAELWPVAREALITHEHGELDAVYPELSLHAETRPLAVEHSREADELEATIQQIDALPMDSVDWEDAFDSLVAKIEMHVEEEEKTIFPRAQKVIGDDRAKALDPMFKSAQRRAKHAA
jgi:hemerythrin superfamily protein